MFASGSEVSDNHLVLCWVPRNHYLSSRTQELRSSAASLSVFFLCINEPHICDQIALKVQFGYHCYSFVSLVFLYRKFANFKFDRWKGSGLSIADSILQVFSSAFAILWGIGLHGWLLANMDSSGPWEECRGCRPKKRGFALSVVMETVFDIFSTRFRFRLRFCSCEPARIIRSNAVSSCAFCMGCTSTLSASFVWMLASCDCDDIAPLSDSSRSVSHERELDEVHWQSLSRSTIKVLVLSLTLENGFWASGKTLWGVPKHFIVMGSMSPIATAVAYASDIAGPRKLQSVICLLNSSEGGDKKTSFYTKTQYRNEDGAKWKLTFSKGS